MIRVLPNQIVKPKKGKGSYIGDQLKVDTKDDKGGYVETTGLNYRRPFDKVGTHSHMECIAVVPLVRHYFSSQSVALIGLPILDIEF